MSPFFILLLQENAWFGRELKAKLFQKAPHFSLLFPSWLDFTRG
ncbi:hypothetical protein [Pasteurella sp. PK-2025]